MPGGEPPGARRSRQTRLGVDRDWAVEQTAEDGQIEAGVGDEGTRSGTITHVSS